MFNIERNRMNYWERRLWDLDHIAQAIDHRDYLASHIEFKAYGDNSTEVKTRMVI